MFEQGKYTSSYKAIQESRQVTNSENQEKSLLSPWKNISNEDIKGEIWRGIPGYNDCYLVSNFGRIKSVDRVIYTKNNKQLFYREKILKGTLLKYKNNTLNDYIQEVKVGIFYCGKYSNIRIARLVYNLFVMELNFSKDGLMVVHKDGNRYNNFYLNLTIQTHAQKQSKLINSGRRIKIHKYHNEVTRLKAAIARQKAITQFNLQGFPLQSYQSIKDAASKTGIGSSAIVNAAKHLKMVSAGSYLWKYGFITHKIDTSYYTEFINKSKKNKPKPIKQLSNSFQIINEFNSISEAAKKISIHPNKITQCLKDNNRLLDGKFYWRLIKNEFY